MRTLTCLLAVMAVPLTAPAQGRITGTINPHPEHAGILIRGDASHEPRFVDVDSSGRYRAEDIPVGLAHLTVRALGYLTDSADVVVQDGLTTQHDFALRVDSAQLITRYPQWLHCAAQTVQVRCSPGRHVLSDRKGFRDTTAWVFADSLAFARFLGEHPSHTLSPSPILPAIDWRHEAVVVVSYGLTTGCLAPTYVNRVEYDAKATTVFLGPDSGYIGPPSMATCQELWDAADIVVVPAPTTPVLFRTIAPHYPRPPSTIHLLHGPRPRAPNGRRP